MSKLKFCSRCGKELDFFDIQQEFCIHKKVGYGSVYDGCTVNYRLCCDCFDELIGQCKFSPIEEGDM